MKGNHVGADQAWTDGFSSPAAARCFMYPNATSTSSNLRSRHHMAMYRLIDPGSPKSTTRCRHPTCRRFWSCLRLSGLWTTRHICAFQQRSSSDGISAEGRRRSWRTAMGSSDKVRGASLRFWGQTFSEMRNSRNVPWRWLVCRFDWVRTLRLNTRNW